MLLKNFLRSKIKVFTEFKGVAAVILALLLPALIGSIYYAVHFAERTGRYVFVDKDCSADAILAAVKNYNFAIEFGKQKNNLLYYADKVYNDHAASTDLEPIEHEEDTITFNKFYSTAYSASPYNQFVSMYSSVDGCYQNGWFYDTNYLSDSSYLASTPKVYNVSIPNSSGSLSYRSYLNLPFPANKPDAYNETTNQGDTQHFGLYKTSSSNTFEKKVYKRKYESDTSILDIKKDGSNDTLTVTINEQSTGETYQATAAPEKCNVDIVLCIPTNEAACNTNNKDTASENSTSELPVSVSSETETISDSVKSTPIYQISQACKSFLLDNFFGVQGVNVGLVPYSGKLSIPHYHYTQWGAWTPAFIDTYYSNQRYSTLKNRVMGYHLYGTYGDPTKTLTHLKSGTNCDIKSTLHKYGVPIMYQKGSLSTNSTYGGNYDLGSGSFDFTAVPSSISFNGTNAFRLCNMWPAYMGYANTLSGKADDYYSGCNIDYQPNPYYVIELSRDILKVCDLLECLRPIYDKYNVSNFCWLPLYWSNCLLNASWTEDPYHYSTSEYFSQEKKDTSGRHKAVVLFVNKPDHFEPNELTYLGFNNDNNELYLGESEGIRFNVDYGSSTYRFLSNDSLSSACSTSTTAAKFYSPKKILKFEQTGGTLAKTSTDNNYYWHTNGDSTVTAKLTFPKKHLIRLVFEGEYVNEAPTSTVTFNSSNGVSDCRIGSTDGEVVPLDTPYTLTGETEFVFKGGTMPTTSDTTSGGTRKSSSAGPNFGHNLSPYKVRYSLSNAEFVTGTSGTSCTYLKDQILRDYGCPYNADRGGNSGFSEWPALILSNGKLGSKGESQNYNPYSSGYTAISWGQKSAGSTEAITASDCVLCYFRDSCIYISPDDRNYGIWSTGSGGWIYYCLGGVDYRVYGINGGNPVCAASIGDTASYVAYGYWSNSNRDYWGTTTSVNSADSSFVRFTCNLSSYCNPWGLCFMSTGSGRNPSLRQLYILNAAYKYLLSTTTINNSNIKEPGYYASNSVGDDPMRKNEKLVLTTLSSAVNDTPAGNWICFQGDGELHVKVKPESTASNGLYISNLKDRSKVMYWPNRREDINQYNGHARKIIWVYPDAISDDKDSEGNYHLDLQMKDVRLISAEIMNRDYTERRVGKNEVTVTLKNTETTAPTTTTDSQGRTITTSGDTIRTYEVKIKTDHKMWFLIKPEAKTRTITGQNGTVTFYSSNGVSDCRIGSTSGTSVTLDSPYTLTGETEFVFKGMTDFPTSSSSSSAYYSFGGPNFRGNFSPYKVRYSLNDASITAATLKDQIVRENVTHYGYKDSSVPDLILANGEKAVRIPESILSSSSYKPTAFTPYGNGWNTSSGTCYASTTENTSLRAITNLFRDSCIVRQDDDRINWYMYAKYGYWHVYGASLEHNIIYGITPPFTWYLEIGYPSSSRSYSIGYYTSSSSSYNEINCWSASDRWKINTLNYSNSYSNCIRLKSSTDNAEINRFFVKNHATKSLYSTSPVDASTLSTHMSNNTYIDLTNLSSAVNDVPAGNWICFQGDGELHVKVKPTTGATTTETFYEGDWKIPARRPTVSGAGSTFDTSLWPSGDMWLLYNVYKDSNLADEVVASWNQTSKPGGENGICCDIGGPEIHAYTRDSDGNYIYTIKLRNATAGNNGPGGYEVPMIYFTDPGQPTNQRVLKLYKNANYSSSNDIYNGISTYYPPTELYPYFDYGSNSTYGIGSAYGSIYNKNYAGDGTLLVGAFSEYPCFAYLRYSGKLNERALLSDCVRVFMKNFRNSSSSDQRFHLDNYANSSEVPYYGWGYRLGTHFTYPRNLALDKYLTQYPSDTPTTNIYDQDAILRKVTQRCASNLKSSGNVKVYVVKYRKQSGYKDFPIYSSTPSSRTWDYDYLDDCASGSDYIYDCSNEDELKNVLKSIASQIKKDTDDYEPAHLITE